MVAGAWVLVAFVPASALAWRTGAMIAHRQSDRDPYGAALRPRGRG